MAPKRTPRPAPLEGSPMSADRGAELEMGRFGQPRTPTLTAPSEIKARQTAYWPPRRKPRVPSMGSKAHILPWAPPALLPASMARCICSSLGIGPPSSVSEAWSSKLVFFTRSQIWLERFLFSRREEASSSPTISSEGKLLLMAWMISAWAPKSPIVTGDLSSFERVPLAFSWKTRWVSRVARCTASWAMCNSFSYDMVGEDEKSLEGIKGERCCERRATREDMMGTLLSARILSGKTNGRNRKVRLDFILTVIHTEISLGSAELQAEKNQVKHFSIEGYTQSRSNFTALSANASVRYRRVIRPVQPYSSD